MGKFLDFVAAIAGVFVCKFRDFVAAVAGIFVLSCLGRASTTTLSDRG